MSALLSVMPQHPADNTIRFAGYAAIFARPDASHDVILPGAFRRTLAERGEPIPLFWQHRPELRIGWADYVAEDARGLRVIARIDRPSSRAAKMLSDKSMNGLSFGYRAHQFRNTATGRILADVELFEISLVSEPLQHGARVHHILRPANGGRRISALSGFAA